MAGKSGGLRVTPEACAPRRDVTEGTNIRMPTDANSGRWQTRMPKGSGLAAPWAGGRQGAERTQDPASEGRRVDQPAVTGVSFLVFHRDHSTPPAIIAKVTPSEIAGSTLPTIWFQKIFAPMNTSTSANAYFR